MKYSWGTWHEGGMTVIVDILDIFDTNGQCCVEHTNWCNANLLSLFVSYFYPISLNILLSKHASLSSMAHSGKYA